MLISPLIFIKKVFKYYQAYMEDKFSKNLIFTPKLELYHWQQILSIVFLEVTESLCSFSKKLPARYSVLIIIVYISIILLRQNDVPRKWLFLPSYLSLQTHVLCVSHFVIQNIKKFTQEERFNKVSHFNCFIKEIGLKEIGFFPLSFT